MDDVTAKESPPSAPARSLPPKVVFGTLALVFVAAAAAIGGTWIVESRRDLVVEVPDLGKFAIRDPKDVIQSHLLQGKPWEPGTVAVFRRYVKPGMKVVDMGAYNGVHTIRFANMVGPSGHVYAFEPNPLAFDMLAENVRLNHYEGRIDAYPVGVADKASTAKIVTPFAHNLGGTNACTPEDERAHRRDCDTTAGVMSSMVRIDDDVNRWFPTRIDFVKIDVEGYEDHVLAGSKEWLLRDHPLLWIEIWDDDYRAQQKMPSKAADIVSVIKSLGYREEAFLQPWDHLFVPVAGATPRP
jgi:FkbM family methyltransferase